MLYAASMWQIVRTILGIILILFGLFALITPFTPGSWLALIGLELVGGGFLIPKKVRASMQRIKDRIKARIFQKKAADPTPISPLDPQEP